MRCCWEYILFVELSRFTNSTFCMFTVHCTICDGISIHFTFRRNVSSECCFREGKSSHYFLPRFPAKCKVKRRFFFWFVFCCDILFLAFSSAFVIVCECFNCVCVSSILFLFAAYTLSMVLFILIYFVWKIVYIFLILQLEIHAKSISHHLEIKIFIQPNSVQLLFIL